MTADPDLVAGREPKRATIVDVARRAGVSTASASKVARRDAGVSPAMQKKVNAAIDALGYRPHRLARGMRGRTFAIGVMLSDLENPFFSILVTGMREALASAGYELLIAPATADEASQDAATDSLIDHRMDGLVLVGPRSRVERLREIGRGIPTVVIGPHGSSPEYDTVSGDDMLGARLVVDYLVALGHRRIAFLANRHPGDMVNLPEAVRARGYEDAMKRHGLDAAIHVLPGEWSHLGGRRAARQVLETYPPQTALFAGADVAALGVLAGCGEIGARIPEDLALVGYDNSLPGALPQVGLTSVDLSSRDAGAIAAQLLLERIHGRTVARNEMLKPRLVVRRTTIELNTPKVERG